MRVGLASAISLFVCSLLPAQGKGFEATKTPFPFNPLAAAAEGDWASYVGTETLGKEKRNGVMTFRIGAINGDEVEVTREVLEGGNPETDHGKVSKERPLIENIFANQNLARLSGVKVTSEKRKVGEREFDCEKATCVLEGMGPSEEKGTLTVWVSPEVKGLGIVEMRIAGKFGFELKLAGFGSKDKADFGKMPPEGGK